MAEHHHSPTNQVVGANQSDDKTVTQCFCNTDCARSWSRGRSIDERGLAIRLQLLTVVTMSASAKAASVSTTGARQPAESRWPANCKLDRVDRLASIVELMATMAALVIFPH